MPIDFIIFGLLVAIPKAPQRGYWFVLLRQLVLPAQ